MRGRDQYVRNVGLATEKDSRVDLFLHKFVRLFGKLVALIVLDLR
jgi:hypothetical protein